MIPVGSRVKVPTNNYHGYVIAEVERHLNNGAVEVRAVKGTPWTDYSHGGWCATNLKRVRPEVLELIETAPVTAETASHERN